MPIKMLVRRGGSEGKGGQVEGPHSESEHPESRGISILILAVVIINKETIINRFSPSLMLFRQQEGGHGSKLCLCFGHSVQDPGTIGGFAICNLLVSRLQAASKAPSLGCAARI